MVVTKLRDILQKAVNPFRGPVDDRWRYLSDKDRREIARYLKDNIDIIEKFLGPIDERNEDVVYKLLRYIETYSIYERLLSQQPQPQQNHVNKYTVFDYITTLKTLTDTIEDIKDGHLLSLPQYQNVAKPSRDHIMIVFGIKEKPKETLIEILERAIGGVMVRGYPAFYYNPARHNNADLPLIYYVQLSNDKFFTTFFIHSKRFPQKTTGYLLDELSRIIQPKRKSLILPSGNQYHIINDYLGRDFVAIDSDPNNPNTDPYIREYIRKSTQFFYGYQEFRRE
jgi:hypothetical protein